MPRSLRTPFSAFRLASRTSTGSVRNEVAVGIERLSFIACASIAAGPRRGLTSPAIAAAAAAAPPAPSAAASTSALVTLPLGPEPFTALRSTPLAAAMRRATGETRRQPAGTSAARAAPARLARGAAGSGALHRDSVASAGGATLVRRPRLISASTWPTFTVSSTWAWILVIVPLAGAGTSASTLSVETSTTVSPSSTGSPSCLCHSRIVPSVTDSPISGIVI